MDINHLSSLIIKAAIKVHKELGPGLLESVYQRCMVIEVENVVELKSVEQIRDVHKKQLLTYLRLADKSLGLLINFNEVLLKNGITRIINNRQD